MSLSWSQIFRLGLVQMALGSIVVLTTSTLNRLMVVEFSLPALLPGALVGLHYGIQLSRPRWGFRSDVGGNRTRWIIGGMMTLALGGVGATYAVTLFAVHYWLALIASIVSYGLIGIGVGASGTSLLALLATATAADRRAAAATITWLMMIFGIALTAGVAGQFLDPLLPRAAYDGRDYDRLIGHFVDGSSHLEHRAFGQPTRFGAGHPVSRGSARSLGGIQNAEFYNFRLSVNECVFHAGIDP
jgi:MFS family permease